MSKNGWYYLHTNGDLIFRPEPCDRPEVEPGGFVRKVWAINTQDRASAWLLTIEAAALGARPDRIEELIKKWELTNEDAIQFVDHVKVFQLKKEDNVWHASFTDPPHDQDGYRMTALEALVDLARPGLVERH